MLDALVQLGCRIEAAPGVLSVHGVGTRPKLSEATFFLGNAGTAMRPLTAALAIVASATGAVFELRGTARMHERPIGDLVDALRALGCAVECLEREGYPPLRVSAGPAGLLLDAPIRVRGDVSSQFLSALLLALPLRSGRASSKALRNWLETSPRTRIGASRRRPAGPADTRSGGSVSYTHLRAHETV